MGALRGSVLVALVSLTVVVVLASPAFATPALTASSGSGVVQPFITPVTSTTSPYTFRATNWRLTLLSQGITVACNTAQMSLYVGSTHTQARITSASFGTGAGGSCGVVWAMGNGTVDGNSITCDASSVNPWFWHVRESDGGSPISWNGSLNVTTPCSFVVTAPRGSSCLLTLMATSIPSRYTNALSQLEFDRTSTARVSVADVRGCRMVVGTFNSTFEGTFRGRPDTVRDGNLTITAAS
jgi:hypothetical protein